MNKSKTREKRKKYIKFKNIKNNNLKKDSRVGFEDGWKKTQEIISDKKRQKHNTKKDEFVIKPNK